MLTARPWEGSNQMITIVDFVRAYATAKARTERGASLVEYALLLALIAVVCITALTALGLGLNDNYDENRTSLFGS